MHLIEQEYNHVYRICPATIRHRVVIPGCTFGHLCNRMSCTAVGGNWSAQPRGSSVRIVLPGTFLAPKEHPMAACTLPAMTAEWCEILTSVLDRRSQKYFFTIILGMLLGCGRRTVSCWLRAAGVSDDSPTKRYGPKVQLAGTHHNPTPGPSGSEILYGHV
jgi:hypothetical protein